jgi:hypothetical protein
MYFLSGLDTPAADRGDRAKLRAKTARYWPGADAQAGGVSDMSRKVGTEWAGFQ